MTELCAECPVTECQRRLETKVDTNYRRLAQAWLSFLAVNKALAKPADSTGPVVEYFEEIDDETNEVVRSEVTTCCSKGILGVPDAVADIFGDPLVTGMPVHDEGGNTYNDLSMYVVDGSLDKEVSRTLIPVVAGIFKED